MLIGKIGRDRNGLARGDDHLFLPIARGSVENTDPLAAHPARKETGADRFNDSDAFEAGRGRHRRRFTVFPANVEHVRWVDGAGEHADANLAGPGIPWCGDVAHLQDLLGRTATIENYGLHRTLLWAAPQPGRKFADLVH